MLGPDDVRRTTDAVRIAAWLAVGASVVLAARWVVGRSGRVLGWALVAVILAALLYPIVERAARRMRRGLAIAVTGLGVFGTIGVIVAFVIDDVRSDLDRVRVVAPRSAARWERDARLGQFFRDVQLRVRVEEFLDSIPSRLVGGSGVDAVRAATTRGVAMFITVILTLFLVGFATTVVAGSSRWLSVGMRRALAVAFVRAHRYLALMAAKALVIAVVVFLATRAAEVPGAAVFGLAAMLGSFVPRIGLLVVLSPIALVDVAVRPGTRAAILVIVLALLVQIADWIVLHVWIEPRSMQLGSALPLVVFLIGLELWGIGGGLCALALLPLLVAWWDEHHLDDPVPLELPLGT